MENSGMKKWLAFAVGLGILCGLALLVYQYYSYLFSRVVDGKVSAVSRISGANENFVIAIRQVGEGTITARTDDPRWALVQVGQCAKAKFFPYPPWNLGDAGMYFRATLLLIHDCEGESAKEEAVPTATVSPAENLPTPGTVTGEPAEIPGAPHATPQLDAKPSAPPAAAEEKKE